SLPRALRRRPRPPHCPGARCRSSWTRSSARRFSTRSSRRTTTAPPRRGCSALPSARCATAWSASASRKNWTPRAESVTGKGKSGKGKGKTGSPTAISADGLVAGARYFPSPNCDERPAGCAIELLVVHHISLPPGEFGGPGIIELFTNRLDAAAHPYYAAVAGSKVSAHFLIRRDGELIQFVSCARRAWHAGESSWKGRARCNDFSIGVELEGTGATPFTEAQYARLVEVTRALAARYPIAD